MWLRRSLSPGHQKTPTCATDQVCTNSGSLFVRHTKFRTVAPRAPLPVFSEKLLQFFSLKCKKKMHRSTFTDTKAIDNSEVQGHSRNVGLQNGICSCTVVKICGLLPYIICHEHGTVVLSIPVHQQITVSTFPRSQLHAALLLEKLTVPQTFQKISALYGTRLFITIPTTARHFP